MDSYYKMKLVYQVCECDSWFMETSLNYYVPDVSLTQFKSKIKDLTLKKKACPVPYLHTTLFKWKNI